MDRLDVFSSKMRIPSDFRKFQNNNNNKEILFEIFEIIEETLLSHNNTSIDTKIYFTRGSTCKLLSRGYGHVKFTVNHEEADIKIICLVKHTTEDSAFDIRSTSGDIDIPVILINAETNAEGIIANYYMFMLQL